MESDWQVKIPSTNQQEKVRNGRNGLPMLFLSVFMILVIFIFAIVLSFLLNSSVIYDGVLIQNENVGG